ncbi:protease modulator HflC [Candidatus Berkiella cookevillensis]|uniref:Protein HflC n=1 Tax=Candidatus Berkiella cookevillensis TaxID=437022 RepID=A0A0Q9YSF2_9GAMM|nr:protease modulator HflC [Candidatus Berkiella cookevillensis]MCS5707556.1 protease modulator HflC [Candidatus Berkiella cookevillensis]
MNVTKTLILTIIAIFVLAAGLSLYTVNETQRAIVTRLGQLLEDKDGNVKVFEPGLHIKMPFIDQIKFLDKRLQTTELSETRMPTKENEFLIVSLFTKWHIRDFKKFYNASGTILNADHKIKEQLDEVLRTEVAKRKIDDLVWEERDILMDRIQSAANEMAKTLGVEVVDARVVRLDLPDSIQQKVFTRMETNIRKLAAERRTAGERKAREIVAEAYKDANVIRAKAKEEGLRTQGEGDAKATRIYAEAYKQAPEFYLFYRRLEAYRETFKGNNDILVLKPDDDFFKYFRRGSTKSKAQTLNSGAEEKRAG